MTRLFLITLLVFGVAKPIICYGTYGMHQPDEDDHHCFKNVDHCQNSCLVKCYQHDDGHYCCNEWWAYSLIVLAIVLLIIAIAVIISYFCLHQPHPQSGAPVTVVISQPSCVQYPDEHKSTHRPTNVQTIR